MKITKNKTIKCAAVAVAFVLAPISAMANGAIVASGKVISTHVG